MSEELTGAREAEELRLFDLAKLYDGLIDMQVGGKMTMDDVRAAIALSADNPIVMYKFLDEVRSVNEAPNAA